MTATRTPGAMYLVRQSFPSLSWQVVQVDEAQGRAMRKRGEPHVYDSSAQAFAVRTRLEVARVEKSVKEKR